MYSSPTFNTLRDSYDSYDNFKFGSGFKEMLGASAEEEAQEAGEQVFGMAAGDSANFDLAGMC